MSVLTTIFQWLGYTVYNASPPAPTSGQLVPLQSDAQGNLLVSIVGDGGGGGGGSGYYQTILNNGSAVPQRAYLNLVGFTLSDDGTHTVATPTVSGDVSAATPGTFVVTGLQTHPIATTAPVTGAVPIWGGSSYAIRQLAASDLSSTAPTVIHVSAAASLTPAAGKKTTYVFDVSGGAITCTMVTSGLTEGTEVTFLIRNPSAGSGSSSNTVTINSATYSFLTPLGANAGLLESALELTTPGGPSMTLLVNPTGTALSFY